MNTHLSSLRCADPDFGPGRLARKTAGFTLVEILMAISLSTLILGAASFFMFSSFNLFTQAQNDPGLEHHRLGVQAYVQTAFDLSLPDTAIPLPPSNTPGATTDPAATGATGATGNALAGGGLLGGGGGTTQSRSGATLATTPASINSTASTGLTGTAGAANTTEGNTTAGDETSTSDAISIAKTSQVVWGWPPNIMGATGDPYLSFVIPSDDPLLVWDQGPRPPVRAFLSYKEGQGLELIWIPPPVPGEIEMNPIRRTMLSPLVTKMTYIYYDPRTSGWEKSDTPPKDPMAIDSYILPDFVQLTFNLNGKISRVNVRVPPAQSSVPIY